MVTVVCFEDLASTVERLSAGMTANDPISKPTSNLRFMVMPPKTLCGDYTTPI